MADGGNLQDVSAGCGDLRGLGSTLFRGADNGEPVGEVVGNAELIGERGIAGLADLFMLGGDVLP